MARARLAAGRIGPGREVAPPLPNRQPARPRRKRPQQIHEAWISLVNESTEVFELKIRFPLLARLVLVTPNVQTYLFLFPKRAEYK